MPEAGERPTGPIITLELPNPLNPQNDAPKVNSVAVDGAGAGPAVAQGERLGGETTDSREPSVSPDSDYESADHLPRG